MITAVVLAAEEAAEEKMPLIPHIPELVWGLVMVGVVYFVVARFVAPKLEQAFAERHAAIEGGIAQAEAAQAEAAAAKQQYETQLQDCLLYTSPSPRD